MTKKNAGAKYGKYAAESYVKTSTKGEVALCGGAGLSDQGDDKPGVFKDFVEKTLLGNGIKNWPTSTANPAHANGPAPVQNDNAIALAKDLVKELTPEEKTIVA
ncbi:MAG: P44/Msp2 family outer membrane protein, partial [Anaplasma sp.]|nr:P44/Msp2 family outer membrane protein [Anaplasma sp.]